ncbi:tRNA 2-thiouridine(34) synthase MnmA [Acanthopleuribacter pedis]|uniref:tRNA-specific 2-thiouridylase MnmA n=1 Tax=Acanthopleuribacter pedis TaxID=442870 RepID=A0A8J7Q7C5_9BACT|nr:tRNA 2-thiouridine(34) synthase MnmA [Acanthopleuribacter pedis]MBO1319666.1 tRNA 2-thiouridine(34) synthase MnmA [Acanthopleuribacter pedis]
METNLTLINKERPAKRKVVVGLSGGVDSAVAAYRLKEEGHEVIGIFMKNWEDDDEGCTAEDDHRDARLVAGTLGIPFYTFNFVKEYWDRVFQHFLAEYGKGYTPNPDILCNKEIKFKAFLEKAMALKADNLATGHYARVVYEDGAYQMLKGVDPKKDQSYFLYTLQQNALSRAMFPLGDIHKSEVRDIAKKAGLPNWDRKDSTGICFIGERNFKDFLKGYLGMKPGVIEDPNGKVVGKHDGLMFHTIGQRQGLGIGGPGEPWYVAAKDTDRNVLIAAQGKNHPILFAPALQCSDLSTTTGAPLPLDSFIQCKIRYRQDDQACRVSAGPEPGTYLVQFPQPQRAIAPKQSIVFYQGDRCLGGGVIDTALREAEPNQVAG